jgi:hypothetical protein
MKSDVAAAPATRKIATSGLGCAALVAPSRGDAIRARSMDEDENGSAYCRPTKLKIQALKAVRAIQVTRRGARSLGLAPPDQSITGIW